MSTFSFGFRVPIKAHEEVILGVYLDARMVVALAVPALGAGHRGDRERQDGEGDGDEEGESSHVVLLFSRCMIPIRAPRVA